MTITTSHHDLNSKDMQYLKDIAYLKALERSPEEEVQHHLDCIQSAAEEKRTLHELTMEFLHTDGKEWINEEMNIGSVDDSDNCEYWTQLLDEAEMHMDMTSFEDELMCHKLFADNPWEKRESFPSTMVLTKKSHLVAWAEVTQVGESYTTGSSDYGKVFIPNDFAQHHEMKVGDYYLMTIAFKGFESARTTTMPWRCLNIHSISKP